MTLSVAISEKVASSSSPSAHSILSKERDISLTEVYRADEVFCTGTMGELASVTRVDGRVIGDGKPGALTLKLSDHYRQLTHTEGDQVV